MEFQPMPYQAIGDQGLQRAIEDAYDKAVGDGKPRYLAQQPGGAWHRTQREPRAEVYVVVHPTVARAPEAEGEGEAAGSPVAEQATARPEPPAREPWVPDTSQEAQDWLAANSWPSQDGDGGR